MAIELPALPWAQDALAPHISAETIEYHYGTTNLLAVDQRGNVSGITTTSGLSWKINGRIEP